MAELNPVQINLNAAVDIKTADVQKALQAVKEQIQPGAAPAGVKAPDPTESATRMLERAIGKTGTFIENRKKLMATYVQEQAHVRALEADYKRLANTQGELDDIDKHSQEAGLRYMRDRLDRMRDIIRVGTTKERAEQQAGSAPAAAAAEEGGGIDPFTQGGLVGAGIGKAKALILAHPVLATAAAIALTAKYLKEKADEYSEYSEKIETQFEDVGRRTGAGLHLRDQMEPGRMGTVSPAARAMGYSGENMLKMASAYGMPGMTEKALLAQGGFARAFGFGNQPEEISGIGRRATQLGIAEPGQQPAFWRTMTDAVLTGQKHGIDASETMRSLLKLTEEVAANTGVVSENYVAGLSGLQKAFEAGSSRFFKGETGAGEIKNLLDAFQHPKGLAQERFIQNSILSQNKNKMLTGEQLGLTGGHLRGYNEMEDVQKLQYIVSQLPALMANKNLSPAVRGIMSGISADVAKQFGSHAGLGMQGFYNVGPEKQPELRAALEPVVAKIPGMTKKRIEGMSSTELMQYAFGSAEGAAAAAKIGQTPASGASPIEMKEQIRRETTEEFSKSISDATLNVRTFAERLKAANVDLLALTMKGHREEPLTPGESAIGGLSPGLGMAAEAYREWRKRQQREGRKIPHAPGTTGPEGPNGESLLPDSFATPQLQNGPGMSMEVQPILVSGTIDLTGAGEGSLPAAILAPLIQRSIEEHAARLRSMRGSRPRQMSMGSI